MTEHLEEDKPLLTGGFVGGNVSENFKLLSQDIMDPPVCGDGFVTESEEGIISDATELDEKVLESILNAMSSVEKRGIDATGLGNCATEYGYDAMGHSNCATEYGNDATRRGVDAMESGIDATEPGTCATDNNHRSGNDAMEFSTNGSIQNADSIKDYKKVTECGEIPCCHGNKDMGLSAENEANEDDIKKETGITLKCGNSGTDFYGTECSCAEATVVDLVTKKNGSNCVECCSVQMDCDQLSKSSNFSDNRTNSKSVFDNSNCKICCESKLSKNENISVKIDISEVDSPSKNEDKKSDSPLNECPIHGEFPNLKTGGTLELKQLEVKSSGNCIETSLVTKSDSEEKSGLPDSKMTEAQKMSLNQLSKSPSDTASICTWPTQSTLMDFCRICHCEGDAELGPLIAPCYCRGSLRYVHQACLQQWIKSSDSKHCELCGYHFLMDSKLKPFRKWKKLSMSTTERRKIMCSVMFHIIAITCVIWSLYVLIERTASEVQVGKLQWPFWTKLVVVAIGFTGGLVFMYVQCKVYFQLWKRLKAFNRVIYVKNNLPTTTNNDGDAAEGEEDHANSSSNPMPQQSNEICIVEC